MATHISEINDLFMTLTSDHKLTAIFTTSGSAGLNTYLESWLLFSIRDFSDICDQSLVYSKTTQTFSVDLSDKNMTVLAQIMTRYWLERTVNDLQQINNYIQDKDFKMHSAAQNLKEKKDLLILKVELIDRLLGSYSLKVNDWDSWYLQNFAGG